MKKMFLILIVLSGFLFAWNVKSSEKYVLQKTIKGIDIVYNVNGNIIYLGDIIDDLKEMESVYRDVKAVDFGYPLKLDELKYRLIHDGEVTKIESYNHALRILEYAIFITAYNYGKAKGELKKVLEQQYYKLIEDFRILLKMSRKEAHYKDELYYPTYVRFDQYKNYIVGPVLYNFVYNFKIKTRRKY